MSLLSFKILRSPLNDVGYNCSGATLSVFYDHGKKETLQVPSDQRHPDAVITQMKENMDVLAKAIEEKRARPDHARDTAQDELFVGMLIKTSLLEHAAKRNKSIYSHRHIAALHGLRFNALSACKNWLQEDNTDSYTRQRNDDSIAHYIFDVEDRVKAAMNKGKEIKVPKFKGAKPL